MITIEECDWLDSMSVRVTWCWSDGGVPIVTVADVEFEGGDPGVGLGAGFAVHSDGPPELDDLIADLASERALEIWELQNE